MTRTYDNDQIHYAIKGTHLKLKMKICCVVSSTVIRSYQRDLLREPRDAASSKAGRSRLLDLELDLLTENKVEEKILDKRKLTSCRHQSFDLLEKQNDYGS